MKLINLQGRESEGGNKKPGTRRGAKRFLRKAGSNCIVDEPDVKCQKNSANLDYFIFDIN